MADADFDFEKVSAGMLGRDMAKMMQPRTKTAVLDTLNQYTDPDGNDRLVRAVVDCLPDKNYERGLALLNSLKRGICEMI